MTEDHAPAAKTSRRYAINAALRRARFHRLVEKAIRDLPAQFSQRLENIDVAVTNFPTHSQLAKSGIRGKYGLLGLYEGIPHNKRDMGYGMVLPDRITIFQKPIEAQCRTWKEIEEKIRDTVLHEVAHHFGTDDSTLAEIEDARLKAQSAKTNPHG